MLNSGRNLYSNVYYVRCSLDDQRFVQDLLQSTSIVKKCYLCKVVIPGKELSLQEIDNHYLKDKRFICESCLKKRFEENSSEEFTSASEGTSFDSMTDLTTSEATPVQSTTDLTATEASETGSIFSDPLHHHFFVRKLLSNTTITKDCLHCGEKRRGTELTVREIDIHYVKEQPFKCHFCIKRELGLDSTLSSWTYVTTTPEGSSSENLLGETFVMCKLNEKETPSYDLSIPFNSNSNFDKQEFSQWEGSSELLTSTPTNKVQTQDSCKQPNDEQPGPSGISKDSNYFGKQEFQQWEDSSEVLTTSPTNKEQTQDSSKQASDEEPGPSGISKSSNNFDKQEFSQWEGSSELLTSTPTNKVQTQDSSKLATDEEPGSSGTSKSSNNFDKQEFSQWEGSSELLTSTPTNKVQTQDSFKLATDEEPGSSGTSKSSNNFDKQEFSQWEDSSELLTSTPTNKEQTQDSSQQAKEEEPGLSGISKDSRMQMTPPFTRRFPTGKSHSCIIS